MYVWLYQAFELASAEKIGFEKNNFISWATNKDIYFNLGTSRSLQVGNLNCIMDISHLRTINWCMVTEARQIRVVCTDSITIAVLASDSSS